MHTRLLRFFAFCVLFTVPASSAALAAASGKESSGIKENVQSVVSDIVSAGKDVAAGVSDGLDSGLGGNTDKTRVVKSREDLDKLLTVTVVSSKELGDKSVLITLAVKNTHEFPVRLTNLSEMTAVVLLDDDGFSYALSPAKEKGKEQGKGQGKDVTALLRFKKKGGNIPLFIENH